MMPVIDTLITAITQIAAQSTEAERKSIARAIDDLRRRIDSLPSLSEDIQKAVDERRAKLEQAIIERSKKIP